MSMTIIAITLSVAPSYIAQPPPGFTMIAHKTDQTGFVATIDGTGIGISGQCQVCDWQ